MNDLEQAKKILQEQGDLDAFEKWAGLTGNDMSAVFNEELWEEFEAWKARTGQGRKVYIVEAYDANYNKKIHYNVAAVMCGMYGASSVVYAMASALDHETPSGGIKIKGLVVNATSEEEALKIAKTKYEGTLKD